MLALSSLPPAWVMVRKHRYAGVDRGPNRFEDLIGVRARPKTSLRGAVRIASQNAGLSRPSLVSTMAAPSSRWLFKTDSP